LTGDYRWQAEDASARARSGPCDPFAVFNE
jgi:hypothetical protein